MLALLGKTGCGKSTIFNMIAGLTEPTSGTVRVSGRDPFADFDSFRGGMAIVFRTTGCRRGAPPSRTSNWGSDARCAAAERRTTAQLWLTNSDLAGTRTTIRALSGGMRQRVSIARAFATNADILLCDKRSGAR
jgi:NitT/TauT family transport system ATP-binding protein